MSEWPLVQPSWPSTCRLEPWRLDLGPLTHIRSITIKYLHYTGYVLIIEIRGLKQVLPTKPVAPISISFGLIYKLLPDICLWIYNFHMFEDVANPMAPVIFRYNKISDIIQIFGPTITLLCDPIRFSIIPGPQYQGNKLGRNGVFTNWSTHNIQHSEYKHDN